MTTVEIYTRPTCGFCHVAKRLLTSKGVSFAEVNVSAQPEPPRRDDPARQWWAAPCRRFSSTATMWAAAMILCALERGGKLDALLAA